MTRYQTFDTLREGLASFTDATTSLYIPLPDIQTGGEKWRILQKNLAAALDDQAPDAVRTREFVQQLGVQAFRGMGMAVWDDGEHFRTAHLSRRPVAMLVAASEPYLVPVLADLSERSLHWLLALDLDKPVLYFSTGARLINQISIFDAPNYEEVEERREIQDDVFFHTSSRGSLGGNNGSSKFHALGADKSSETEKTEGAYFRDVINALEASLPPQVRTLHVAGDPGVVGEFAKLIKSDHLSIVQHHCAGEALQPDRLLSMMNDIEIDIEPMRESISSAEEISAKAANGQIDTLYISEALSQLEEDETDADEHLRIRDSSEAVGSLNANEQIVAAIATGANLEWRPASDFADGPGLTAVLRWDDTAATT
jgi:hypothetical protein